MMSMKGWVASLTLKNYPSVDIFVMDPATGKTINIQVKTLKNSKNFPVGMSRSQRDFIEDRITCPYVFVYLGDNEEVSYYIISRQQLIDLIIETDDEYFYRPRKKELKDYPIGIDLKHLVAYKDKWDNLWI